MTGFDTVRAAAEERGLIKSSLQKQFTARCPAHDDTRASLSVGTGDDGRALIHCFAGCELPAVVEALGLSITDLFGGPREKYEAAKYIYTDEHGHPLVRVTRFWPKGFTQERWDEDGAMWQPRLLNTRRVLYNLPAVINAETVWLAEGEKDAESLIREGVVGATLLGGAQGWRDEYATLLQGKRVNIIADRDEAGRKGALRVKNGLRGFAKPCVVLIPPEGYKDVTDLLNAGLGLGDLEVLELDDKQFLPMEWEDWKAEEVEWLLEPYVPKQARVMVFGAAGSLKSLWAMWVASQLSKEGHRVAYFSLEMSPREVARRLKKMDPPKDKFRLFRSLNFDNAEDLAAACDLLQGYSLIVVDSWSAVSGEQNSNDAIAKLDRTFFLPLIEATGATLVLLDNTGQSILTDRGQKMSPDWARGASAKGDKMDLSIHFEQPEGRDHTTKMTVKKMRGDRAKPRPLTVKTDPDNIDFRIVDDHDVDLGSMWRQDGDELPVPQEDKPEAPRSLLDRLRDEREKARLREEELG